MKIFLCLLMSSLFVGSGFGQTHSKKKLTHKKDTATHTVGSVEKYDTMRPPPPREQIGEVDEVVSPSYSNRPDTEPKTYVEQMPEYPGGSDAMYMFIKERLKYPQIEKEAGIEETIYMRFVVDTSGTVGRVEAIKGRNKHFIDAATTCIKSMPKWIPGRMNGKLVRVYFMLPFRFRLN